MKQPQLGLTIAALRKAKNITQEDLAFNCKVNVRTIQRIESGSVFPRGFTLNMIFSFLDYKMEEKQINLPFFSRVFSYFNQILSGNFEHIPAKELSYGFIRNAWIAGVIYFMLGFAISGIDYLHNQGSLFITGKIFYIVLKFSAVIASVYYLGGFVVIGSKLKNHVLVISSLITIFALVLFSFYDIISLFYNSIEKQMIDGGKSITFGIIGIVYGIGILRLTKNFGKSASFAGILNITGGFFFLTLIFWFMGIILSIPSEIFEIVILYKAYKYPGLLEIKT